MYTLINQTPAIYHSANPAVMFRIIEHDGIISEKTFLYGYCVGVSYGKNGLTWVITNLIGGKLELYWSKVDKVNPLNVEMIANILVKRSGREFERLLSRASAIIATVCPDDDRYKELGWALESRSLSDGDMLYPKEDCIKPVRLRFMQGSREKSLAFNTILAAIGKGDHDLFVRAKNIYEYLSKEEQITKIKQLS